MPATSEAERRSATTIELLRQCVDRAPDDVATFHRAGSGAWVPTTWSMLWREVQRVAAAFRELGLQRGDRAAIMARTCREWQVAELAIYLAGAVVVGIDAHAAGEQAEWIFDHARACCVVVDGGSTLAKIPASTLSNLKFVVTIDDVMPAIPVERWRRWRDVSPTEAGVPADLTWMPGADTPATLIYTSGTTGTPKGIEYSHGALMTACWAMLDQFPGFEHSRLVCWLPMAALFQRMMNLLSFASHSVTYFVEDPREIVARIAEIRPTIFTSVPRFYEKLYDGIQERLETQSGLQRYLVDAALKAGRQWSETKRNGIRAPLALRARHAILDFVVLRRIRAVMGGEMKWMLSGSAAAPIWLLEFFHSIGLLLLEAYGITENPVPVTANRLGAYRFGSVGKPFPPNQVRLAEDGEVLVKGPAMFLAYLGEGPPTGRLTPDGFFRTGDYGRIDSDGFLYLTGRGVEIIKTSTGRRISPAAIEGVYRQSRYIDQMVVVGNNRPYLVALIALNATAFQDARGRDGEELAGTGSQHSSAAIDLVKQDLAVLGRKLARHEQIRDFALLPAPLSVATGELTTTLKPRRDRIEARHRETIAALYGDRAGTARSSLR